jgi:site-specific DNA recombinase
MGEGERNGRMADIQDRIRHSERRLSEIQIELASLDRDAVDESTVATALAGFDDVSDVLQPWEQARGGDLLIERVDFDVAGGNVAIQLRPTGIRTLGEEAEP